MKPLGKLLRRPASAERQAARDVPLFGIDSQVAIPDAGLVLVLVAVAALTLVCFFDYMPSLCGKR